MNTPQTQATVILQRMSDGDPSAGMDLFPLVYAELHTLAQKYMQGERASHTLGPTALVHEAFLRLVGRREERWETRMHFFRVAARAMREVLIDHSRLRNAEKRRASTEPLALDDVIASLGDKAPRLALLDEALEKLKGIDPELARIVDLRFFGGLTTDETAEIIGKSARTVERAWRLARAWLHDQVTSGNSGS